MGISMGLMLGAARRPGGGATIIASDTFTRADNAASMGSTESGSAGALVWTRLGTGTYGILSNQAYPAAAVGNDVIEVDTGVASCTVSYLVTGGITFTGLCFRLTDASNFWRAYHDGVNLLLDKVVAGVPANQGSAAQPIAGDTIAIVLSGNTITVKKNGVTIIGPVTDAFNASATKHGLYLSAGSAAVRWDNFLVTVP